LSDENKGLAVQGLDLVIKSIKTAPRTITGKVDFVKK